MPPLMTLVWFAVVGLCAGWLAGMFTQRKGFGVLGNMIVGVIGAFVGVFLLRFVGAFVVDLIVATAGSIVLLTLLRFIPKPR
jgi:uncharacterized membrane protein YeaQ/YmgE (transglycosylase-associated protein family)